MRFQREFEQKPLIIHKQFSKNVTFSMRGTSSKSMNLLINLKRTIDKQKQNKDDVPRIKNVTFQGNCRCFIFGFCLISI